MLEGQKRDENWELFRKGQALFLFRVAFLRKGEEVIARLNKCIMAARSHAAMRWLN